MASDQRVTDLRPHYPHYETCVYACLMYAKAVEIKCFSSDVILRGTCSKPDFTIHPLSHREVIRRKRLSMLNDGVILLHDNTHTAPKTQELLRKFKWEVCSHFPTGQIRHSFWVPNTYLEEGSLQRVM
ncbi:hypothetical protein AVEN_263744-1 [Araneus ventricosus]|uniref:Mariner Mos1 transposase n=1 Tax=Araneus ventricosus TaxID=182803 RepID=A0A4Y2ASJ1_ARAVE|nr:hypothetical protein AVEN_263744-1 [Araneus ventricosus]